MADDLLSDEYIFGLCLEDILKTEGKDKSAINSMNNFLHSLPQERYKEFFTMYCVAVRHLDNSVLIEYAKTYEG